MAENTYALPPWPPTLPYEPMPYDQRGCGWPWGPSRTMVGLQMRYGSLAFAVGSTINPAYAPWDGGQMMLADVPNTGFHFGQWTGMQHLFGLGRDTLQIFWDYAELNWHVRIQAIMNVILGVGFEGNQATAFDLATNAFDLELSYVQGPNPKPTHVRVRPILWYDLSPYPYYP